MPQDQPPIVPEIRPGKNGRGRDPWVFRLIFEDRTRMVAVALAQDMWYVFNPETCAPYKVWHGKMDFRGKVWDFSQDNSRAQGTVLAASPSDIASLANGTLADWTARGVTWSDGWKFDGDSASLTSPVIDLSSWQRVFVAFDERSRKGRIKVEVSADGGMSWNAQWFGSATSVTNDTDWQWNFKLIETHSAKTRLRFVQERGENMKSLRNVRFFGDKAAWADKDGRPIKVVWRGYETRRETESVSLMYDLVLENGHVINVRHRPEVTTKGWSELISLRGFTKGDTVLYLPIRAEKGVSQKVFLQGGNTISRHLSWRYALSSNGDVLVTYEVEK